MTDATQSSGGQGPSHRGVEIGAVIAMAVFGAIVISGSLQVGINWGAEGPRSGFFPFYLGLIIVGASAFNLTRIPSEVQSGRLFAEWGQLRQVLAVVLPTAVYVGVIPWIGIYIASAVLIALFMTILGRYSLRFSAGLGVAVVVAIYLTFEKWFLVPLPKGPIEELLGL